MLQLYWCRIPPSFYHFPLHTKAENVVLTIWLQHGKTKIYYGLLLFERHTRIVSQQIEAQGHSMKLPGSRSAVTVAFPFTVHVISMQNCCGVYGLMYKQVPRAIRQNKRKTDMEQWLGCNLPSRELMNCRFHVFLWVTRQNTSVCHAYLTACFILKITFITKI